MSYRTIAAAITTLKENRNLKRSQRDKFKSKNRHGIYSNKKEESLKFKEVTDEELEIIKKKIHLKLKENRKKQIIILIISTIISISVVVLLFN